MNISTYYLFLDLFHWDFVVGQLFLFLIFFSKQPRGRSGEAGTITADSKLAHAQRLDIYKNHQVAKTQG